MKDVNNVKGIHVLRTLHSTKRRSIPKIQSSTYLDLYILNKERERLLKEDAQLCMRKDAIKKRLEEIDQEVNKPQEAEDNVKPGENTSSSKGIFTQRNGANKEWKKMSLAY